MSTPSWVASFYYPFPGIQGNADHRKGPSPVRIYGIGDIAAMPMERNCSREQV